MICALNSPFGMIFPQTPPDDFGWLSLSVETDLLVGRGGFWVQWQDVEEWAARLDAFPIVDESTCSVEWGQADGDGSNYETIIGVWLLPANKTGDIDVITRITDRLEARRTCQAVFRTNYPDIGRFSEEIKKVMQRHVGEAVLSGENLP